MRFVSISLLFAIVACSGPLIEVKDPKVTTNVGDVTVNANADIKANTKIESQSEVAKEQPQTEHPKPKPPSEIPEPNTETGNPSAPRVVTVTHEASQQELIKYNCKGTAIIHDSGLDLNGDGTLNIGEIAETRIDCNEVIPGSSIPEIERTAEFGVNEIFRVGDGFASSGSACMGQVNTHELRGTKYYFQFEVVEDNTEIDLSIGRVCGVDQLDKDTFSLIDEATKELALAEKPLPKQIDVGPAQPWFPYSKFKLRKGIYSVVIHSKNVLGRVVEPGTPIDPNKDEYDDFLVGNIKLNADNRIKAIKIYAE